MSDFSDRAFVAGSLVGIRAFDVDAFGRLVGPVYAASAFKPGENKAKCYEGARWSDPPWRNIEPRTGTHKVGSLACKCGFYAYFDGGNDYGRPHRVTALIEGYGICTVGSRGFRAEKAKLVALVVPTMAQMVRRHLFTLSLLGFGIFDIVRAANKGQDGAWWSVAFSVLAAVSCLAAFGFRAAHTLRHGVGMPRARVAARHYPDVPTFPTLRAALKAHPVAPPAALSPETDEHFWERKVVAR